ncbi:MAG: hypothetical protein ABIJ00_05225 [Candidatus Eisenbacteria bacterium]
MVRMLAIISFIVLMCSAACAQSIMVEAEHYITFYNAGGTTIYVTTCSAASGGLAVEGFDWTGDWIELVVNIPLAGSYADSIRAAGLLSTASEFQSTVINGKPGGGDLVSTFNIIGLGIG